MAAQADRFTEAPVNDVKTISGLCTQYFTRAEREHGIPKHLLMAIANTESGRYHPAARRTMPWPWTLNIEGQGYYFDTLHDAATAIRRAKQRGKESIDVGCMQVNLKHHPHAFSGVTEALNPARNVEYAAKFLRQNYDELRSWPKAIAAYHSRTASRGRNYLKTVRKKWRDIVVATGGKSLEDASYTVASESGVQVHRLPVKVGRPKDSTFELAMNDGNQTRTFSLKNDALDQRKSQSKRIKPSMKVITVSTKQPKHDAVVTVTPLSQRSNSMLDFVTSPGTSPTSSNSNTDVSLAAIETTSPASNTTPMPLKKSPNFIFGRQ